MKVIFKIMLAGCVMVFSIKAVEADENAAQRLYLTAYETMKSADYLKDKGLDADAADMYLEALRLYQQIAQEYPDWQSDLVAYRLDYCRKFLKGKGGIDESEQSADKKSAVPKELSAGFGTNYNKVIAGPWRIEARVQEDGGERVDVNENEVETRSATGVATKAGRREENFDRLEEMVVEARKAERSGDYVSALAIYNNVLEYKVTGEILKGALRSAIRVGDQAARKRLIEIARKSNIVKDAELKYLYGLSYCIDKNFAQAVGAFQEASMQDPTNPLFKVALGVAFAGCGKFNEAETEMRKALSINSKIADAYYNLAWIRLALKGRLAGGAMRADYQNALRYGADPDPILERNIP
jgi:tetratricopeptide (TPR) repeat protein